ncbi:MAG: PDZ domain-containing protein, partial [Rubrivivax sp.]
RPGDVVVKVAGARVINTSQLLNAVAALKPGLQAQVEVQRSDKILTLDVMVVQRPKLSRAAAEQQAQQQEDDAQ